MESKMPLAGVEQFGTGIAIPVIPLSMPNGSDQSFFDFSDGNSKGFTWNGSFYVICRRPPGWMLICYTNQQDYKENRFVAMSGYYRNPHYLMRHARIGKTILQDFISRHLMEIEFSDLFYNSSILMYDLQTGARFGFTYKDQDYILTYYGDVWKFWEGGSGSGALHEDLFRLTESIHLDGETIRAIFNRYGHDGGALRLTWKKTPVIPVPLIKPIYSLADGECYVISCKGKEYVVMKTNEGWTLLVRNNRFDVCNEVFLQSSRFYDCPEDLLRYAKIEGIPLEEHISDNKKECKTRDLYYDYSQLTKDVLLGASLHFLYRGWPFNICRKGDGFRFKRERVLIHAEKDIRILIDAAKIGGQTLKEIFDNHRNDTGDLEITWRSHSMLGAR
jgi:hypothetical protein